MLEILKASKKVIQKNLQLLAEDYREKTGRKVCLSCPSDIAYMILSLKHFYKMRNFEFKRNAAQYKNKKGDNTTISNSTMTDEKAIEFLRTNPERIALFSKFPEDWETLIKQDKLTDEQVEEKLAIKAELEAIEAAKSEGGQVIEEASEVSTEALTALESRKGQTDLIDSIDEQQKVNDLKVEGAEVVSPEEAARIAGEKAAKESTKETAAKKTAEELSKMKLSELREAYPEIKATSIKDFVKKVMNI